MCLVFVRLCLLISLFTCFFCYECFLFPCFLFASCLFVFSAPCLHLLRYLFVLGEGYISIVFFPVFLGSFCVFVFNVSCLHVLVTCVLSEITDKQRFKQGALRTKANKDEQGHTDPQRKQKTRKHKTHWTKANKQGALRTNKEKRTKKQKHKGNTKHGVPSVSCLLVFVIRTFQKHTYYKQMETRSIENERTKKEQTKQTKETQGIVFLVFLVFLVYLFVLLASSKKKHHKHM